ncbi:MAG: vWA domain-containing protein [Sulfurifustaceae bacterium]
MLIRLFLKLRAAKIPVTLTEFLALLEAMKAHIAYGSVDEFYYLARSALVKDETHYDKFDRVFGEYIKGIESLAEAMFKDIPADWLRKEFERLLTDEEKAEIKALGGLEKLLETLRQRLEEQKQRHQGGNKWIGTGGTSPFGAYGYNPEGIRIGQDKGRNKSAVKVWDQRAYKDYDDSQELGTRNIKLALRRLRKFARQGAPEELDLDDTIKSTARNAGWLDLKMVPERHNAVKVLAFFDVGGSMDDHIRVSEELFSAVRSEFKHLEYFYFHNFLYESVWRDNQRRYNERLTLPQIMRTYGHDYKLVIIGDASMSPYEIFYRGGSVDDWNEEPGETWLQRLLEKYPSAIWLNPEPEKHWGYTESITIIRKMMNNRMYPLTLEGLERGMRQLSRRQGVPEVVDLGDGAPSPA